MLFPDIRNVADHSGEFLKNINSPFGLTSPIQPSRLDEKRGEPFNNYQHNLNLSLELQKLVEEHRMMEDYPMEGGLEAMMDENQEPLPLEMPQMDFLGNVAEEGLFGNDAAAEQSTGANIIKKGQQNKR